MSRVRIFALAVLVGAPLAASASDAPHNMWSTDVIKVSCDGCHLGHGAASGGGGLYNGAYGSTNTALCTSCHAASAEGGKGHGFSAWTSGSQAVPGTSGTSHRWDALATNLGATPPATGTLLLDTDGKHIMCSTCHDPHTTSNGGSQFASWQTASPQFAIGQVSGSTLTLASVSPTAAVKGYLIKCASTNTFLISHDGGKTWYNAAGVLNGTPTSTNGTPQLDDGANVTVQFSSCTLNYQWKFYVGRPFLRMSNDDGQMCVLCHKNRNQNHANVEGQAGTTPGGENIVLGTTVFSHPVGETLNINGKGTDRAPAAILDADGASAQTPGDGNPTNDLRLSATGKVTCLTCHSPHHADSNSLTVDVGK